MQDKERKSNPPYRCPVCGYPGLEEADPYGPSWSQFLGYYEICPCCGTEFGCHVDGDTVDELQQSIRQRREEWIRAGHHWFDDTSGPPPDWDWKKELRAIAVEVGDE